MAMTLISEQVLGSSTASVTFSSIPQTYKDLVVEVCGAGGGGGGDLLLRYNNDSASNYSDTSLRGNGSSAGSSRYTNQTATDVNNTMGVFGSDVGLVTYNILSYSGSTYKTTLVESAFPTYGVLRLVALWRGTAAITRIDFFFNNSASFNAGSSFRLWGVS